ncbi:MAG: tRNA (guanosine(37)-N1)-methyltransferase TrmD [bacterium]
MTKLPKIKFEVLTLFPEVFDDYCQASILGRAQEQKLIAVTTRQLRDWATDNRKTVDDAPYGGGPGMIMQVEPFDRALKALKAKPGKKSERIILFGAKGKPFTNTDAERLAKYRRIIFLCGRYEGVDERVRENLVDEEISIGPYVLTGGELPAMVLIDAISRQVPGVLGKEASLDFESHKQPGVLEAPQYTRPPMYKKWPVPEVLMSGNHALIEQWKREHETHSE